MGSYCVPNLVKEREERDIALGPKLYVSRTRSRMGADDELGATAAMVPLLLAAVLFIGGGSPPNGTYRI